RLGVGPREDSCECLPRRRADVAFCNLGPRACRGRFTARLYPGSLALLSLPPQIQLPHSEVLVLRARIRFSRTCCCALGAKRKSRAPPPAATHGAFLCLPRSWRNGGRRMVSHARDRPAAIDARRHFPDFLLSASPGHCSLQARKHMAAASWI